MPAPDFSVPTSLLRSDGWGSHRLEFYRDEYDGGGWTGELFGVRVELGDLEVIHYCDSYVDGQHVRLCGLTVRHAASTLAGIADKVIKHRAGGLMRPNDNKMLRLYLGGVPAVSAHQRLEMRRRLGDAVDPRCLFGFDEDDAPAGGGNVSAPTPAPTEADRGGDDEEAALADAVQPYVDELRRRGSADGRDVRLAWLASRASREIEDADGLARLARPLTHAGRYAHLTGAGYPHAVAERGATVSVYLGELRWYVDAECL